MSTIMTTEERNAYNLATNRVQEPFNFLSAQLTSDPYPVYEYYREHDPIHWGIGNDPRVAMEQAPMWFFFRHADITAALKDNRLGVENPLRGPHLEIPPAIRPLVEMNSLWMLQRDPPAHTRLRSLVSKAFTPQTIQKLALRLQEITESLIAPLQKSGRNQMEVISEFAFPLPVMVIAELLGVPVSDQDKFKHWSNLLLGLAGPAGATQATLELIEYFNQVVSQRRLDPQANLLSKLIEIEEEGNSRLSEAELVANCILLLVAGHETTVNLIGNGLWALLRQPDQLELLKQDTNGLIEGAVEELLRYGNPVQHVARFAQEDMEIGGRQLQRGESVRLMIASANYDPQVYTNPNQLDITRQAGRHSAFGLGIHFCLGAHLARLEGQIALSTLLQKLPSLRLAREAETAEWNNRFGLRGLKSLTVQFG